MLEAEALQELDRREEVVVDLVGSDAQLEVGELAGSARLSAAAVATERKPRRLITGMAGL